MGIIGHRVGCRANIQSGDVIKILVGSIQMYEWGWSVSLNVLHEDFSLGFVFSRSRAASISAICRRTSARFAFSFSRNSSSEMRGMPMASSMRCMNGFGGSFGISGRFGACVGEVGFSPSLRDTYFIRATPSSLYPSWRRVHSRPAVVAPGTTPGSPPATQSALMILEKRGSDYARFHALSTPPVKAPLKAVSGTLSARISHQPSCSCCINSLSPCCFSSISFRLRENCPEVIVVVSMGPTTYSRKPAVKSSER